MISNAIFLPVLSLATITGLVWIYMFALRLPYLYAHKIDLQAVDTAEKLMRAMSDRVNYPAHNLNNLTELPVLFYVTCVVAYLSQTVDQSIVVGAWLYVAFRAVHSIIHCTYNNVKQRFTAYILSSITLWFLVGKTLLNII